MAEFVQSHFGDLNAIGAAFFWALAIVFFQLAGNTMSALSLNLFKNALGFVLVIITGLVMEIDFWPDLSGRTWGMLVVSALLGLALADVLLIASLCRLGTGMQAVVDCAYAPSIILVAFVMFGEVLGVVDLLGGALVLLAVYIGARDPQMASRSKDLPMGILFGVTSHVSMGIGIVMLKDIFNETSLIWIVGVRLLIGELALILFCLVTGKTHELRAAMNPKGALFNTFAASFLGAYLSMLCWVAGFKYSLAGRAAIYNQLASIFMIILAWMFLKERFTRHRIAAVVLALCGAIIVSV